jgi:hypothetical protein
MEAEGAKHHSHHGMAKVRFQVLVWAGAGDHGDAVFAADAHRVLGNAGHAGGQTGFGAHHAVHPDVLDAEIHALPDDLVGDLGVGEDEDGIRLLGDGFQIRVAGVAFEGVEARINGADGVAGFFELAVAQVATGLAFVRDADHGDIFLGEEIFYEGIDVSHGGSFHFDGLIIFTVTGLAPIITDEGEMRKSRIRICFVKKN